MPTRIKICTLRPRRSSTRARLVAAVAMVATLQLATVASSDDPVVDEGIVERTERPDADLVIARERPIGAEGVDLTPYGIGTGDDDFVQSIYLRLFASGGGSAESVARRIQIDPRLSVLGMITRGVDLGGGTDDGKFTESDADFGVGDPDDYSAYARGFEGGSGGAADEFVCQSAPDTVLVALSVTNGLDDLRLIVDHGTSFLGDVSIDVSELPLAEVGGDVPNPGTIVGKPGSPVLGAGDYGESVERIVRLPLTGDVDPALAYAPPFDPFDSLFLLRLRQGTLHIDGYELSRSYPFEDLGSTAETNAPIAMSGGPWGRLYAIEEKAKAYSLNPIGGGEFAESDLNLGTGRFTDIAHRSGTDQLYVSRKTGTGVDSFVDRLTAEPDGTVTLDLDEFQIARQQVNSPEAIAYGPHERLYVLDNDSGLWWGDLLSRDTGFYSFSPPIGEYEGMTARRGDSRLFLVRNRNNDVFVDIVDLSDAANPIIEFGFVVLPLWGNVFDIAEGVDGNLYIVRKTGDHRLTIIDPATGTTIYHHDCLEQIEGRNLALASVFSEPVSSPGEVSPGETPMLVTGYDPDTGNITITYEAACGARENVIAFGDLTRFDISEYRYTGRDCAVGNSGFYEEFNPGPGSHFFVLVAQDKRFEGSYGQSRDASGMTQERPPAASNVECWLPQSLGDSCDSF